MPARDLSLSGHFMDVRCWQDEWFGSFTDFVPSRLLSNLIETSTKKKRQAIKSLAARCYLFFFASFTFTHLTINYDFRPNHSLGQYGQD